MVTINQSNFYFQISYFNMFAVEEFYDNLFK